MSKPRTPFEPADRCKDCIWYATFNAIQGLCHLNPPVNSETYQYPLVSGADDYCKYGEK